MQANTKYPILLIHGMGFRDSKIVNYWGRIPKVLEQQGASIYYGNQDCNGAIENNAKQLEKRLQEILDETGAEKVNIIAHSKGGLEARYLISSLGCEDKIASLTTLQTPHNGSITVDRLMKLPQVIVKLGCRVTDVWFKICGDRKPDTYKAIMAFKTKAAEAFNEANPDSSKVYYQSYGFVMKNVFSDLLMWLPYLVVHHYEGENDGLLAPRAVRWTNYQGTIKSNSHRGISHCDEVDMRRRPFTKRQGQGISDITGCYLMIVMKLKEKGL